MASRPLYSSPVTKAEEQRGDGDFRINFLETFCRSTKDTVASRSGTLLVLRPWQKKAIRRLYARRADGRRKHRVGLMGLPRKNGKSALGSGFALAELFMGDDGGEVYSCAADKDQARIVFGVAKQMVEADPELNGISKLYRDAIEVPSTGSVYRVLSSEAFTKEGLSPTFVVYDELHAAPTDELWNVMNLGTGARVDPLVLAITTAGVRSDQTGRDSVCYRMFQHGQAIAAGEQADDSFYFDWWGAPDQQDHRLPATWKRGNPGYADLLDPEDFASSVIRTPEPEFRTKRLNQWVASAISWLPAGSWENLELGAYPEPGADVVLGFDGSYRHDATALVVIDLATTTCSVVGVWERPDDADDQWVIPRGEVNAALNTAFEMWNVKRMYCDKAWWADAFQGWEDKWGAPPVMEFPQTPTRMAPACAQFYGAVMNKEIRSDGNPTLARHLRNAITRETAYGAYITKQKSAHKIDAAVAVVLAYAAFVDETANDEVEVGVAWI